MREILDIKKDIVFKKVFLDERNIDYLKLLINKLLKIKNDNLKLANTEIPNGLLNKKSSHADIILKNNNYEYIIEMNYTYSDLLFFKNYYYLFKEHTKRSYKGNNYGKNKNTILINIDNYDKLKNNKLIYEIDFREKKYNSIMYYNIKSIHINLDYLKNKYYNNYKLNELEKILLIFIENNKDKLLSIVDNKKVRELIEFMDYLKIGDDYITVYNKEEFDNAVQEEYKRNIKNMEKMKEKLYKKEKYIKNKENELNSKSNLLNNIKDVLDNQKNELDNQREELLNDKLNLNKEKIEIAKELKILGIPIKRIHELTKLSLDQICML